MDSEPSALFQRKPIAFILPMAIFLVLLAAAGALRKAGGGFLLAAPEYWIYPVQTLLCGALLLWFWREYEWQTPRKIFFAIAVGLAVFALWIAPQQLLGFAPRVVGFDPNVFRSQPALYWGTILFRFLRLVIVVPLVEEIFWRGFVLRYLINERFTAIPIRSFSWFSFGIVTLGFSLAHSPADWIAAIITGALYNVVAYRTQSLASCVCTHALTNLLLGAWIMATRQWGFW